MQSLSIDGADNMLHAKCLDLKARRFESLKQILQKVLSARFLYVGGEYMPERWLAR